MKDRKQAFRVSTLALINLARRLKVAVVKETVKRRNGRIEAEIRL